MVNPRLVTEQTSTERFTKPNWNEWDARPVSDFQMRRDDILVNEESQLFLGGRSRAVGEGVSTTTR